MNSQVCDHTSVLRFLEARFGVPETNISPWRRAVMGDLVSAFDFAAPNSEPVPDLRLLSKAQADAIRAEQEALGPVPVPTVDGQAMPAQARGVRFSRALPYELHTSGRADPAGGAMQLLFANTGTAGAVFHVYDRLHLDRLPRRYTLEAGTELDGRWDVAADGGAYDLWVLGPNGYHRHFKGRMAGPGLPLTADPEIRVCYEITRGDVYVSFFNRGDAPCTFQVQPNAYYAGGESWSFEVAAGGEVEQRWELAHSGGWYDFSVTLAGDGGSLRRFAGRVETGKPSISDPAMGA